MVGDFTHSLFADPDPTAWLFSAGSTDAFIAQYATADRPRGIIYVVR